MGERAFFLGRVRLAPAVLFVLFSILGGVRAADGLNIVASLFPQFDFARTIVGGKGRVRMLLPPGSESHSFEPTPGNMKAIADADLFIYTGGHMEPWARRIADAADGSGGVRIVDASEGIRLERAADVGEHGGHEADDRHAGHDHFHEFDPHVWLDPVLAAIMVDAIAGAIIDADPENASFFRENAETLKTRLRELDEGFRRVVAAAPRRGLVFGERFAFSYFFSRYGLEENGPYKTCAPGADPGLRAVIETVERIRAEGVAYVYKEAASKGRISEVLRQETGVTVLDVDSMHTISAGLMESGATYVDIMRANMRAFAKGLE